SPKIPTSGDTIPPPTNGNNPKKADALPADFPCCSIARENDVVEIIPTLETIKNNATLININDNFCHVTTKSNKLPNSEINTPPANRRFSAYILDSLPVICAAITIPTPFKANKKENCCGLIP